MQNQERDEGWQSHNYEKWQAGNSGRMSIMRYEDVQDRESLKIQGLNIWKKLGVSCYTQSFY